MSAVYAASDNVPSKAVGDHAALCLVGKKGNVGGDEREVLIWHRMGRHHSEPPSGTDVHTRNKILLFDFVPKGDQSF